MGAVLAVVADVLREQSFQMAFVRRDDVVEEIPSTAFHPSLGDPVLPRTFERSSDRCHPKRPSGSRNLEAILSVTIEEQEPSRRPERKRLPQLLDDPGTGGMPRDVEMQDAATVVADHEEAIEQAERNCGNREEIHRGYSFSVVSEEGKPSLGRLRVLRCSFDPAGDCSLREIEPEHQELTMNAWCSPGRILSDHSEDQIANFFGNMLTANHSASPRDYTPVHGKSCAMPADNRLRAHDDEGLLPSCPESARENPEEFVKQLYVRSRVTTLQDGKLLPKHEVFEQEARTPSEDSENTAEEEPKNTDHGSVLSWRGCGKQSVCC